MTELAPDVRVDMLRILRSNGHGRVALTRSSGTRDGGAFENPAVVLTLLDGEFFEVADVPRALARFEELCAEQEAQ